MTQIELIHKKTWLTEKEAVQYTGFGADVLRKLRTEGTQKGTLPYSRLGNNIRYKRSDIDNFIEDHKIV